MADNPADAGRGRLRDVHDIVDLILDDPFRRAVIDAVRRLGLPDGAIGAGFVRQPVWDHLHGFPPSETFADIDVLYFDPADLMPQSELRLEQDLARLMPGVPWSVKNQSRMHLRNGEPPYRSTEDAIAHWLETPTAVAIPLARKSPDPLIAPFGIDDLLAIVVKPTAAGIRRADAYRRRLHEKGWHLRWPRVRLFDVDGREIDAERLRRELE